MNDPAYQMLGKYQILAEIGRGGFGTVYRALDPDLGREVAVKVLDPLLMREPVWVTRFRREAQVIARLDHPHIVTVYEIGQAEHALYIVERLVTGGSLADRIASQGALPWPDVVRLVGEMAEALDYAHARDVIHRDLKSANVLLDPEHGAQLTDFGFARMVAESSLSISMSGGIVGTPQYMAPEVWEGQPATPQTDIYALGCIVHEMATGQTLFRGGTTPSVMHAHFQPLALPERWPEGVPPGLTDVLRMAVAREPAARYPGAGELARALGALREDPLAGAYEEMKAAAAAHEWKRVIALARQIRGQAPAYQDVIAWENEAVRNQARQEKAAQEAEAERRSAEQAAQRAEAERQRIAQAAAWKASAQQKLAEGDGQGAEQAARKWNELAPGDSEAQAFLAPFEEARRRARQQAAAGKQETRAAQVATLKVEAEQALSAGDVSSAEQIAQRWRALVGTDPGLRAFNRRLATLRERAKARPAPRPRERAPTVRLAEAAGPARKQAGGVVCPNCGTSVPPQARFCTVCGGSLAARAAPVVGLGPSTVPDSPFAGPAPDQAAPAVPPAPPLNSLAVLSFVLSLCVFVPLLTSAAAVWAGQKARAELRAHPGQERGMGLATAGLALGWLEIGFWILGIVAFSSGGWLGSY